MKDSFLEVSKIVGRANGSNWAQVHIFFPQEKEKKEKFGNLIAAISLTAKEKMVDITSFGAEIILRLQETYYSNQAETILVKLTKTIEKLTEEFAERVDLALTLSIFLPQKERLVLYVALNSGGCAILRDGRFGFILKAATEKKSTSGFLKENDFLCLGTEQFFELISEGVMKASMEGKIPEETAESLAPIIHGREFNNQVAAIFVKVKSLAAVSIATKQSATIEEKPVEKKLTLKPMLTEFGSFFAGILDKFPKLRKRDQAVYLKKETALFLRQKKTNFTLAIIMICLLMISIFFGFKEKTKRNKRNISIQGDWSENARQQLDQIASLKESNPLQAKMILKEVEETINKKEKESGWDKKKNKDTESLKEKINQLKEEIMHQYKIENPEIFLDLGLVKENFKGSDISLFENKISVLDKTTGTIIDLDLKNKSSKIVIGNQDLQEATVLTSSEKRTFVLKDKSVFVIDKEKGEIVQKKEIEDLGKVVDMVGFSDNGYLLDEVGNRILKLVGSKEGFSSETDYLQGGGYDLSKSISLAIDGSVWVLFADGRVNKYTRGQKDAFLITGLDDSFNQPIVLYTDKDCDNLYILDRNNTQVVVVSKSSGEYQSAYVWSGIAGAINFVVSEEERKILFLTGTRIYEIGLK